MDELRISAGATSTRAAVLPSPPLIIPFHSFFVFLLDFGTRIHQYRNTAANRLNIM